MPRPRAWHIATLVVLALASGGGCGSPTHITADSTCGDYLNAQTGTRHDAAARISTDLHAQAAGKSMWGAILDTECGAARDTTLRGYFAAQLALEVPSTSMENTINTNDTVLVNTLAYKHGTPRRGEVVVFTAPNSWSSDPTETRFVNRVVGTAGDHVVCCDPQHRLMVNGRALDETYLYRDASGRADSASPDAFDIVVPKGRLWVLGDHRYASGDSREQFLRLHDITQATIPVEALVGRAYAVIDSHDHDEISPLTTPSTFADVPDPTR